ncbi:MAG: Flagellin N-methylase [Methanosaeta sp. PtaB.Bin039]|mgnify:CR=1 FL=1|nr:MAG: Flagellin N-methylase [Methanosaeta sp. PtaB.Bin039]HQF16102.1 YkgJ family cysteine cluster protein [Methanotrichaceae archaeon]HQI90784.1 YkgJ family cysteine cluster protein [Methanotrichaceae archaeon]HQJ28260.1 YkgJ family cysteine cluster protein [Methanotrichaceae archaeon]
MNSLQQEHKEALALDVSSVARQIQAIGFHCMRCCECCQGPDASVLAFPREVRALSSLTGLSWAEVAEPPQRGEFDRQGNFHTLEWRLVKSGPDCRFYSDGCCSVYPCRPLLCRTYPFYLANGELQVSECRGLGQSMEPEAAADLAAMLKERYLIELEEGRELLSRFRDFSRGRPSVDGCCIVHDSEGEHRHSWEDWPGLRERVMEVYGL